MNYWETCITEAFEECGIQATANQIKQVCEWVEGAHENYGMAHGYDCISNPLENENRELKLKLKTEQSKVFCKECNGQGRITTYGPYHNSNSECWTCHGEGKY